MKKLISIIALSLMMMSAGELPNVYMTASGKKYHYYKECQYIKSKPTLKTLNEWDARKQGFLPCSKCAEKRSKEKATSNK